MENIITQIVDLISAHTPQLITTFFIFISFWLVGFIVKMVINSISMANSLNPAVIKLLGQTAKNLLILLGFNTALGTLGVDVSAMVAGLGLTGFALGFALKDILANLISGILILLYEPFKINDQIIVDKYEGVVVDINLRYTMIKQDDADILVPNSFLFSKPIKVEKRQ